jgi:hypothetical protein
MQDESLQANRRSRRARTLRCAGCGCLSGSRWLGQRTVQTGLEADDSPEPGVYCPACADGELGYSRRV